MIHRLDRITSSHDFVIDRLDRITSDHDFVIDRLDRITPSDRLITRRDRHVIHGHLRAAIGVVVSSREDG